MANPVYVACPNGTWVKVASGVKSGTLHTIKTTWSGPAYLYCRMDTGASDIWEIVDAGDPTTDVWTRLNTVDDLTDPDIATSRALAILGGKDFYRLTAVIPHINLTEGAASERVYLDVNNTLSVSVASDLWVRAEPFDGRVLVDMS